MSRVSSFELPGGVVEVQAEPGASCFHVGRDGELECLPALDARPPMGERLPAAQQGDRGRHGRRSIDLDVEDALSTVCLDGAWPAPAQPARGDRDSRLVGRCGAHGGIRQRRDLSERLLHPRGAAVDGRPRTAVHEEGVVDALVDQRQWDDEALAEGVRTVRTGI